MNIDQIRGCSDMQSWEAMHGNTLTIGQDIEQQQAQDLYSFDHVAGLRPFAKCQGHHSFSKVFFACHFCGVRKCDLRDCLNPMMRDSEGGFCAEHEEEE